MANITLNTSTSSVTFAIYSYGTEHVSELNMLNSSFSQSGNYYPQPKSNYQFANKKQLIEGTIELLTEEEKDDLIEFYKALEGKSLTAIITNDIEELYNFRAKFNQEPSFSETKPDYYNFNFSIREIV